MDEVAEGGEELIITKNGHPASRPAPYTGKPRTFFGRDRGRIRILGDIVEPFDMPWEAEISPAKVLDPWGRTCPRGGSY